MATTDRSLHPVGRGLLYPDLPRVEPKQPWRWVSVAGLAILAVLLVRAFVDSQIEWGVVRRYLTVPAMLVGLRNTVIITVGSMALGMTLGALVAGMRMSRYRVWRSAAWIYTWFFRGVPVLLQLLIWFNIALVFPTIGIPGLFSVDTIDVMTPFLAALLGLGVHQSAYTAEIVRSGVLSVDPGQLEAAASLGMRKSSIRRRITAPQAMRVIIPPLGNEFVATLKTSSLAAVITFGELLQTAQLIYYSNNRIIELLIVASIWYLAAVSVLSVAQHFVERRFGRGFDGRARKQGEAAATIKVPHHE